MDPLPPIPTPASQRWREFRIRVLPVVVFICVVLGAGALWMNLVAPVAIIGQVEAIQSTVTSILPGKLSEVTVERFQRVAKDQVLGYVVTSDPTLTEASLNQVAADLKLMQARMELDKERNLDAYSRLRLDMLNEKVALEQARVKLRQAESQFDRVTALYTNNIVGKDSLLNNVVSYESVLRERDALRQEVTDRTKTLEQWELDLKRMEANAALISAPRDPVIEEAIKAQQDVLRLESKPTTLRAPIDGVVSMVHKRSGEKVIVGEPLIVITPLESDRIIAWVRQPLNTVPTTNDTAHIRTRTTRRQVANAQIVAVGTQLEPIDPMLLSPDGKVLDRGLPLMIKIPPGMALTPGEYLDVTIHQPQK